MPGPIRRYTDYDREARDVLAAAGRLAEREGRRSVGLHALRLGLLEVIPGTEASLAEAGVEPRALAALDAEAGSAGGATESFRGVLTAAESAAMLDGRGQVIVVDLVAGLVAVARASSPAPVR
jgi:hypothetical protein